MELTKNLLWVYPAAIMTTWTLFIVLIGWTLPLNKRIPAFVPTHLLLLSNNPKDEYLYQRPSLLLALGFLLVGLIPGVCALLLSVHLWLAGLCWVEAFKISRRKSTI
jgi:hypothetical protein